LKRSTRYRIAKLNRASTEIRYCLVGLVETAWYELRYPAQMAAAREILKRDKEARTFYA